MPNAFPVTWVFLEIIDFQILVSSRQVLPLVSSCNEKYIRESSRMALGGGFKSAVPLQPPSYVFDFSKYLFPAQT